ncbi:hypothetical protein GQ457_07G012810 [Hibiscus cannabinus]
MEFCPTYGFSMSCRIWVGLTDSIVELVPTFVILKPRCVFALKILGGSKAFVKLFASIERAASESDKISSDVNVVDRGVQKRSVGYPSAR